MAGRGPAPKSQGERRRRNMPAAGEWISLPVEGRKGAVPYLPKGLGLSRATQDWWKKIWKTPMATMWTDGDVPALIELAVLRDRMLDGKVSVAAEVRLRSDEFGLTPKGRQERRWLIGDEEAESDKQHTDDELAARRKRMKAVDPGALAGS